MVSNYKAIGEYMAYKLSAYKRDAHNSYVRAQLANLRRGVGRKPGDMPELWGLLFADMPEQLMAAKGEPTYAEWAVYASLTLYALHQQGREIATDNMHMENVSLGQALARLVHTEDDRKRILQRFKAFATAYDITEATYYLRGLIQLLRAEGIGLDYIQLAMDLYSFQFPEEAPKVRLKWGQDFYRRISTEEMEEKNND